MTSRLRTALAAALFATAACVPAAADDATVVRHGITLTFIDAHDGLSQPVRDAVVETFFTAYPRQRADFNPHAPHAVTITIDPGYDGIAYVDGDAMTINPAWFDAHPHDLDLVTHEAMHIVQAYGRSDAPGWLVEGIADYARALYGRNNPAAQWALPTQIAPDHRFDSGYRVTAAFLAWAEDRHPGLVRHLDAALREHRYAASDWTAATGHTVDALWSAYVTERAGG